MMPIIRREDTSVDAISTDDALPGHFKNIESFVDPKPEAQFELSKYADSMTYGELEQIIVGDRKVTGTSEANTGIPM